MPPLNDMGDLGIFLSGVAATLGVLVLIGVNVWKLYRSVKSEDRPGSRVTSGPLPLVGEDNQNILKLKLYLAELAQHNRHDAREALTVVTDKVLESMKEYHRDLMRELERNRDAIRSRD